MGVPLWIVFGLVAGSLAKLVMPGPSAGGIAAAIPLSIGGALLGGWVGSLLAGTMAGADYRSLLMAMIGSLAVLFSYRSYAMRAMA